MCGIFAYLNFETPVTYQSIIEKLIKGLHDLEYRGYDSAGVAITTDNGKQISIYKNAGSIDKLHNSLKNAKLPEQPLANHVGIAHTRWATVGQVNDTNAHPQRSDSNNEFVVIHNGIITNHSSIKQMLEKHGFKFESDTDTEVVAKLAKYLYDQDSKISFSSLIASVAKLLEGAFALVFISTHFPNQLVATKNGSPLLLGIVEEKVKKSEKAPLKKLERTNSKLIQLQQALLSPNHEFFICSDATTIQDYTSSVIYLEDGDLIHFAIGQYHHMNIVDLKAIDAKIHTLEAEVSNKDKGNYPHFILKEIFEQPETVMDTMRGRVDFEKSQVNLGGIRDHIEEICNARRLVFIASASSYHAAMAARPLFESLTSIPISLELSSDFLDRTPSIGRNDACVFISQSGETADVLKALEYCKNSRAFCVGVTNKAGSPLAKGTDCGIYLNCGPEYGVASTKSYTSQIVALIMMALKLGENSISTLERRKKIIAAMKTLPELVKKALACENAVKEIAKKVYKQSSILVMGRFYQNATCLEGALKLKEIGNMHSEGVFSGELKHGPLALVDDTMPIVFVVTRDTSYDKATNAFSQVTARKGSPVIVCTEGDTSIPDGYDKIELPACVDCLQPIVNIVPLQLLAYHVGVLRGLDIDNPKTIAKVVLV